MSLREPISLESFLSEPEEKPYREYLFGRVVQKAVPKYPHARIQTILATHLESWAQASGGSVVTEQRCILSTPAEQHVQLPDVAWFQTGPKLNDGNAVSPPTLAVEILSPDDPYTRVQQKVRVYLQAGVAVVWIVDPESRAVTVWRRGQQPEVLDGDAELADDALPAFRLALPRLFRDL